MADATPESRGAKCAFCGGLFEAISMSGEGHQWLTCARATIASQAEALAAKQMLINMLKIDVAKLDKAIAERDTAEAALKAAREALRLLVSDVQDYEAWQRPCHALDVARAVLAGEPTP